MKKVKEETIYKVGQKVRIKDLKYFDKVEGPCINADMLKLSKKTDIIEKITTFFDGYHITLANSEWTWIPKWLEPVYTKRSSE